MPVGTAGTVKAVYVDQLVAAGADVILGNTYHLMLRPGAERVARLGGLHEFMRWDKPILTDSGGFQVMSLAKLRKITDDGVTFQSHLDGSSHELTPERAIEIQCLLGADIQMQLDECLALPAGDAELKGAVERSIAWAARCQRAFERQRDQGAAGAGQALFAIVQGGTNPEHRRRSAEALVAMDFAGYAVGGLAVGETAGTHAGDPRLHGAAAAARQASLPDGRRHAHRHHRSGGAGHRHVRLRAADAVGAAWPSLHLGRQAQSAQREVRRRPSSARSRRVAVRPRATIPEPTCTTS